MMGVVTLIKDSPEAHGVFDTVQTTERTLKCKISTPSMTETYTAMAQGLLPTYRFTLANYKDYQGEKKVRYSGTEYPVIRVYQNDNNGIEITVDGGGQLG